MSHNWKAIVCCATLVLNASLCGAGETDAYGGLTYADILRMLPKPCMDDERDIAEYDELVAQGESLYGVYLQIARDNTDLWMVQSALSMIRKPTETKREVLAELRQMLLERARSVLDESERVREAYPQENNLDPLDVPLPPLVPGKTVGNSKLLILLAQKTVDIGGSLWPDIDGGPAEAVGSEEIQADPERIVIDALLTVIRECEKPYTVQTALALLKQSSIDRAELRGHLKNGLSAWLPGSTWTHEWMIKLFSEALADIGEESDLDAFAPMLSHSDKSVRLGGALRLGKHGGRKELPLLEQARAIETDEMVAQALGNAIAAIQARLAPSTPE